MTSSYFDGTSLETCGGHSKLPVCLGLGFGGLGFSLGFAGFEQGDVDNATNGEPNVLPES